MDTLSTRLFFDIVHSLPEWLTAIGTLLAVIVALYLSRRDRNVRLSASASIYLLIEQGSDNHEKFLATSVTNIGTRTFTLSGISLQTGIFKKKYYWIPPPINSYSSKMPIKLADGDQASYYLPMKDFNEHSRKYFVWHPWIRSIIQSQFIYIRVTVTTGQSFAYRINKTLRDELRGKKVAA
jgi:hypothetical protein